MTPSRIRPRLLLTALVSFTAAADPGTTSPVLLEAHELTVVLPGGASWRSQIDTATFGYPIDILIRIDDTGLVGVMIDSRFGVDANCRIWEEYMLHQGVQASSAPAVKPEGWHSVQINAADGLASYACLDFDGGFIMATFGGQDPDLPESHLQAIATALDAIRLSATKTPPANPRK